MKIFGIAVLLSVFVMASAVADQKVRKPASGDPCIKAASKAIFAYIHRQGITEFKLDMNGFYYNDEDGEQGPIVLAEATYKEKNGKVCKDTLLSANMKGTAGQDCTLLPPVEDGCLE